MNFIYFGFGVMFLQVMYMLMQYILLRKKEFLYFTLTTVFVTLFVVLNLFPQWSPYVVLPGQNSAQPLLGLILLTYCMYYRFIRYITNLAGSYPRMNKAFIIAEYLALSFGLLLLILGFFPRVHFFIKIFTGVYFLTIPFNLFFILYLGTRGNKLNTIIMLGQFLGILFLRVTVLYYFYYKGLNSPQLISQILVSGYVIMSLFMNFGLLYKTRLYERQNLEMEVQKHLALSQQRSMISSDLHDDLGASLSSIHLHAMMAQKSILQDIPKTSLSLTKMVRDLKLVMENMGDIIWAIDSDGHSKKPISSHLKDFYFEFLDGHDLELGYHIDDTIDAQLTNIKARKNILLIVKEAVNNTLKHAHATKIDISLEAKDGQLCLEICDNGIGFSEEGLNAGHGIRNMGERAARLNGQFAVKTEPGTGTTIACLIPLTNISYFPAGLI